MNVDFPRELPRALSSLKELLPKHTKLLFKLLDGQDEDHRGTFILNERGEDCESVDERYLLVRSTPEIPQRYDVIATLNLHVGDPISDSERFAVLEEWLLKTIRRGVAETRNISHYDDVVKGHDRRKWVFDPKMYESNSDWSVPDSD